jgi:hypothetical protein
MISSSGALVLLLIDHLVPIAVGGHDILIGKLLGSQIHLPDERSMESLFRPGIKAGAAGHSQGKDSEDDREKSQTGFGGYRYRIFHVSRYQPNDRVDNRIL